MNGLITSNETGDLLVSDKAATVDGCEAQIIEAVLLAVRGDFKEAPTIGGEIRQNLGGQKDVFWPQETKKMIKAVGVELHTFEVDDDGVINIK